MDTTQLSLMVLLTTVLILVICGVVVLLLVMNNTRRIRHRAEMAEMRQQQDRAVMETERETMRHTLRGLGRELHDNVGQYLSVALLGLNHELYDPGQPGRLEGARDALNTGIAEVRRLGHDLNTDMWKQRSLVDAIRLEAERVQRVARVEVGMQVLGEVPESEANTKTVLFRLFQLILTNALMHSRAQRIDITIDARTGLCLTIADDGQGFDPESVQTSAGLTNIQTYCDLIGYSAHCDTRPGNGCSWHLRPLPAHCTHRGPRG